MNLTNRVIWIISPESWGEHLLSKHHYALELARRDNEVYFIGRHNPKMAEGIVDEINGVQLVNFKCATGARSVPKFLAKLLQRRDFRRIAAITESLPDVIWSFDNSRLFHLDAAPFRSSLIHHLVDLNQDFEVEAAAKSADLCLATTRFIEGKMRQHNPNSHNIGHGCRPFDLPLWSATQLRSVQAVYAGNLLLPLIDRELIIKTVQRFQEVQFVFLGSYETGNLTEKLYEEASEFIDVLRSQGNVTLRGALQGKTYENALAAADFFFIAYRQDAYEQVANPHKVQEMLSTGRAIVSNVIDSYHDTDLLYMADEHEAWMSLFSAVASNVERYNSVEEQQKRRNHAYRYSYAQQVNHIEELLS